MTTTWTAGKLFSAIEVAHAAPEWACLEQVGNSTGYGTRRHADAIAMSLWPSRGLYLRGFEIKCSRSDYRREARDPMKAEEVAAFCDEWWIVAAPGVLKDIDLELPPAWGLMVPDAAGLLHVERKAERTDAKPLTRDFVAAVLRAVQKREAAHRVGWVRTEDIEDRVEKARAEGLASAPAAIASVRSDLNRHMAALATFREATGIDILNGWRDESAALGEAVKVGRALLGRGSWESVAGIANTLDTEGALLATVAKRLRAVLA